MSMKAHIWHDCRISVLGESVRTVMQDACVVIRYSEIGYHRRIVFVEIVFFSIYNMIPRNFHMLVTIYAALHVKKSQCCIEQFLSIIVGLLPPHVKQLSAWITVQKFMHNCAQTEATSFWCK